MYILYILYININIERYNPQLRGTSGLGGIYICYNPLSTASWNEWTGWNIYML